jgi:hypothetical protein
VVDGCGQLAGLPSLVLFQGEETHQLIRFRNLSLIFFLLVSVVVAFRIHRKNSLLRRRGVLCSGDSEHSGLSLILFRLDFEFTFSFTSLAFKVF